MKYAKMIARGYECAIRAYAAAEQCPPKRKTGASGPTEKFHDGIETHPNSTISCGNVCSRSAPFCVIRKLSQIQV